MNRRAITFLRDERTSLSMSVCVRTPVEAAENVETSVFSSIEVHAEDSGEDEEHHGKVKYHHHRSLEETQRTLCYL